MGFLCAAAVLSSVVRFYPGNECQGTACGWGYMIPSIVFLLLAQNWVDGVSTPVIVVRFAHKQTLANIIITTLAGGAYSGEYKMKDQYLIISLVSTSKDQQSNQRHHFGCLARVLYEISWVFGNERLDDGFDTSDH